MNKENWYCYEQFFDGEGGMSSISLKDTVSCSVFFHSKFLVEISTEKEKVYKKFTVNLTTQNIIN